MVTEASSHGTPPSPGVDASWLLGLPKAEVHCHLEGCVAWDRVTRAAQRSGVAPPASPDGSAPPIRNLAELLAFLDVACALMDTPDDLAGIAYDASRHAAASGTRYLDVLITPHHWTAWRGRLAEMVDALDRGWTEAERDGFTPAGLCLSVNRGQPGSEAEEMVAWMLEARHPRVVGLSIDGNEKLGSNNERFAGAFASAARGGLRRCAHAGESSGPAGVRQAIELLDAERIDHGIRSVEDPSLVAELAARRLPLDICPTSNVVLGLVPEIARHPLEQLRRAGVRVSINTDDPLIYGCDLAGEYAATATAFGWGRDEVAEVAHTSIESCFAEAGRREDLLRDLDRYLARPDDEPAPSPGPAPGRTP